jgi:hypothetical protein
VGGVGHPTEAGSGVEWTLLLLFGDFFLCVCLFVWMDRKKVLGFHLTTKSILYLRLKLYLCFELLLLALLLLCLYFCFFLSLYSTFC